MPLQPDNKLLDHTIPSPTDQLVGHFDPWRGSTLGTTSASLVIACPRGTTTRKAQVALQTLYAHGTGATAKVQIKSGSDVILEYKLADGYPLQMNFFPGNITVEPGEDLTIAVTATAGAAVTATGVIYR